MESVDAALAIEVDALELHVQRLYGMRAAQFEVLNPVCSGLTQGKLLVRKSRRNIDCVDSAPD